MTYKDKLKHRTAEAGNGICMGMDPVLGRIPLKGPPQEVIKEFYHSILNEMVRKSVYPAAVKPNLAFYEGIDLECVKALRELIPDFQAQGILVILDAKRGDIGKTSACYAKMAFEVFHSDAVTVAPYMGRDSIRPFQDLSRDQGIYVLARTSNAGASDFQETPLKEDGFPLYRLVAEKISAWNDGNLGAVVGATAPRELEELLSFWISGRGEVPCLIPGVAVKNVAGGQGGTMENVLQSIAAAGGDKGLHLINSSSGLNYAHEKYPDLKFQEATVTALQELIADWNGG
ncbi:orotidine-5'-phosphate decarboxylase [Fibrobacterota bacterium]